MKLAVLVPGDERTKLSSRASQLDWLEAVHPDRWVLQGVCCVNLVVASTTRLNQNGKLGASLVSKNKQARLKPYPCIIPPGVAMYPKMFQQIQFQYFCITSKL